MFIQRNEQMEALWVRILILIIKALLFVGDYLLWPVFYLLQRPWKRRKHAARVKAKLIKSEEGALTYRGTQPPKKLHIQLLQNKIDTLEKMFRFVVRKNGCKRCLGTRKILSEEDEMQPDGRMFKKYNMGDYIWKSFNDTEKAAAAFGRGLREIGQKPKQNIVIFAETRAEWLIAAHGCFKQAMTIVTVYATLGDEGVVHCITETEVTTVITSHELLPKLKSVLHQCPNVNTIIYIEDQLHPTDTSGLHHIKVYPFHKVLKKGLKSNIESVPPERDDIAIIMYTSGSTGTPKGVLLSHFNCMTTMRACCDIIETIPNDVLMAFLPLAHVLELIIEGSAMIYGVPIGYSSALTLLDTGGKIKRGCQGDANVLKPTCMTTVPLILDRISRGINDKINAESAFKKALFQLLYQYKVRWLARDYTTPLLDALVFKKVGMVMGGHVRSMFCGGAPLAPETHEQIRAAMCVNVVQGYGLTETTSGATAMDERDTSYMRVGAPLTVCTIRLVDWEEGNYCVTNKPYPQGEIIVGGDCVSVGYYKLPEKTAEDFFEEDGLRWFRTGDIGEIHADGVLKIIDRKKDLVKLQSGEYVSLGKVEAELKTCAVVDNICVYANSLKYVTVALVVPNPNHLLKLAEQHGLQHKSFEELCDMTAMEQAVLRELELHAKKCKLTKMEIPGAVMLCKDVWTQDMGLITAAFKLKRKEIEKKYLDDINRMYASLN